MRSILVHADRQPGMDARLETALSLSRHRDGHIRVLIDTPVARYISMDPMGGSYVASDALDRAMAEDDANAEQIQKRLTREGVSFDVLRSEAAPVDALARAARLADVVIISRSSGIAGELALVTRTPILALADDRPLRVPLGRVCVAWDGGDEAAYALRSAIPLLASCQSVKVVTVTEKPGGFPPVEARRYIERHGIETELDELQRQGTTEETLAAAVAQAGAELLVMGAYGKSRVREFLFGGVTRHFLEAQDGPALLLAH